MKKIRLNRLIRLIRPIGLIGLILFSAATAAGQTSSVLQSSFTGGELSPLAAARLDAQRYYQSVATLDNMIALPQGPAVRRPGSLFAAATDSNNLARLLPFRYSTTDCYVLEFSAAAGDANGVMRVYRSHGLVTNADSSIYTLTTPFDVNEIDNLQVWQSADVMYLVDGTDWPQKLVRTDHNDWDINDIPIDDGPFLTENLTATTIAADATTGTANLVATSPIFEAGHVGSYWKLRDLVPIQTVAGTFTSATESGTLTVQSGGSYEWNVHGAWVGTCELQMSYDAGATWAAAAVITSTSSASTTATVYDNDTGQDVLIRAACTDYTSGAAVYSIWTHAYLHTGVVKIATYVDPCNVTATVVRTLASTAATVRWSEGSWSSVRGYPRALGGYNERLVFAGTTYQPLRIWFSATGDWENFDTGEGLDDQSFGYTMGQSAQEPIVWLVSQRQKGLLAGTTGGVLELQPLDITQGFTPGNPPAIVNLLAVPCAEVPPVLADNILLVLQRGGRKLREVLYDYNADSLVAPDLTLFAEHITAGGLTGMAWTSQPYTVLWSVRADGKLLACTYDRNYQIDAWATETLGGGGIVESVCTIPGTTEDEVWLSVRRTVDSNTVRYVEYLAPWDWGSDPNDVHFVDAGLIYDGTAVTSLTGLSHLAGCTVAVCADGSAEANKVVSAAGAIVLDYAASVVHAGLPYTSTLATLRYDFTGQGGTTWPRLKTVPKAVVSFYRTLGATVANAAGARRAPDWSAAGTVPTAGVPALFTGDREIALPTTFGRDAAAVTIEQAQPWPLTVRAIVAEVKIQ